MEPTLGTQARRSSSVVPLVRAETHETPKEPASYDPDFDPAITDPDKFQILFENDRVRVLRCRVAAGGRTHPHSHPDSIVYALSSFRRLVTYADGTTSECEFKAGETMWLTAETHVCENIGTTPTELLMVELK